MATEIAFDSWGPLFSNPQTAYTAAEWTYVTTWCALSYFNLYGKLNQDNEARLFCSMLSGVGDTNGSNGRTNNAELRSACEEAAEITLPPINVNKRSEIATPGDDVYVRPKSITGAAVVNGCLLAHGRPMSVAKKDLDDRETNILRTQLDAIGAFGPLMRKLGTTTSWVETAPVHFARQERTVGPPQLEVGLSIPLINYILIQCEAPKIAKLVYNTNNYGLWYL